MTLTDPELVEAFPEAPIQRTVIARPGMFERLMVVITTFVVLHGLPNTWFTTRAEILQTDGGNPILFVLEMVLIGFAVMRIAGDFETLYQTLRLEPAISFLVGLALASTFWSSNLYLTAKDSIVLLAVTLYAAYLIMRFALNEILRLLAAMFVLSAITNLVFVAAFPQYAVQTPTWDGVFAQKNALGFAAVIAVPALVTVAREHRRFSVLYYAAAIGHVVLLLGSQSKTMLVATLATLALMVIYRGFRAKRTLRGAVIFGLASASAFATAFATANIALLSEFLDKDVTLTGRTVLWQDLIPIFFDRFFIGYGYGGAFGGYFSPIHEVWIQNRWDPSHAHNALLQMGLELGVVGIIAYLFLFTRAISRAIRTIRDNPGPVGRWPLAFFSTALLFSISESGVFSNSTAWMMFCVAVFSVSADQRLRPRQTVLPPNAGLGSHAA